MLSFCLSVSALNWKQERTIWICSGKKGTSQWKGLAKRNAASHTPFPKYSQTHLLSPKVLSTTKLSTLKYYQSRPKSTPKYWHNCAKYCAEMHRPRTAEKCTNPQAHTHTRKRSKILAASKVMVMCTCMVCACNMYVCNISMPRFPSPQFFCRVRSALRLLPVVGCPENTILRSRRRPSRGMVKPRVDGGAW